jgi:tetratricopeptide (TPR) repeat protein
MKKPRRAKRGSSKSRTTPIKRNHNSREANNDLLSKRLNDLMEKENWDSIIETLNPILQKEPDDHWLLAEMANAYYEKRDYETAYKYIVDAMSQQENCPLVLWYLATIFRMRGQQDDAITIWEELINRGEEKLAFDECGEGLDWAKSLIADCKFMLSKTYNELGEKDLP